MLELPRGFAEGSRVIRSFVLGYACPIQRFRCDLGLWRRIEQRAEAALGFVKVLLCERDVGQRELELSQEIRNRQEAFELMPLHARGIERHDGGGPLGAETLEIIRTFFDVDLYRNEVFGDEGDDTGIGIDLGIQPSASTSHRRGREIKQHRLIAITGFSQRSIRIFVPQDRHVHLHAKGDSSPRSKVVQSPKEPERLV